MADEKSLQDLVRQVKEGEPITEPERERFYDAIEKQSSDLYRRQYLETLGDDKLIECWKTAALM